MCVFYLTKVLCVKPLPGRLLEQFFRYAVKDFVGKRVTGKGSRRFHFFTHNTIQVAVCVLQKPVGGAGGELFNQGIRVLGDWRIVTALISGFMAKESIVSMISVLYGSAEVLQTAFTGVQVAALLVHELGMLF